MIKYQIESYDQAIDDIDKLLEAHNAEVNGDDKLNPNYDMYATLYDQGNLFIITARKGDELVGYLSIILTGSMYDKDSTHAVQDAIYIVPKYRHGKILLKLIHYTEEYMKTNYSVDTITYKSRVSHDFTRLLNKLNYETVEITCTKRIGE